MTGASDVIAAAATPPGRGAVGVVRLSGSETGAVLARVFEPARKRWPSHRMLYGFIRDGERRIDEVLCCFMRAPRSYTGEDTAEIYTHGGYAALRGVLAAVIKNGARPAEPGEFTQRAFLLGRIDLAQAEAVAELINAKSDAARAAGLRQLGGGLSRRIETIRDRILQVLAHIELSIDYPEHESEAMNLNEARETCAALTADIKALLGTARAGRVLAEGVRTAIIGRPNVGKSSLLNAILGEDRAIVTDIPGATRDVLTEPADADGVPLLLADTAGIRETGDALEKLGVERSIAQAEKAELILFVADRSMPPQAEDHALWARFGGEGTILVLNKCDLPPAPGWDDFTAGRARAVSARTGAGLAELYGMIGSMYLSGLDTSAREADIITRERHRFLLDTARDGLERAAEAAAAGLPEDLVSIDLRAAYQALGEILGREIGEDITARIFSEFCVGK